MASNQDDASGELKNTTYELFVGALSILSIVNLVIRSVVSDPQIRDTVALIDGVLSLIFLIDFCYRLLSAESKRTYIVRQAGWADLLASLPAPQLKLLRLFRIWRAGRLMRQYGMRRMITSFLADRAGSALLTVLFLIIMVLEFGAMAVLRAERASPDANIKTASDAIWWVYVSITTVGYGDRFPVTGAGRLWGVLVLTAGVGLFGVLTGFLANSFLAPTQQKADDTPTQVEQSPPDLSSSIAALTAALTEQREAQVTTLKRLDQLERLLGKNRGVEMDGPIASEP